MKDIHPDFTEEEKRKITIMKLMKTLNIMMSVCANRSLECVDLTSRQMDILMYLMFCKNEKISQVDIEKQFQMTNPTVTGILNRLEAKGFIARRSSEQDKRVKHIVVTDRAWEVHEVMKEQKKQNDRILFAEIPEDDIEHLLRTMNKLCKNMAVHLGKEDDFCSLYQEHCGKSNI